MPRCRHQNTIGGCCWQLPLIVDHEPGLHEVDNPADDMQLHTEMSIWGRLAHIELLLMIDCYLHARQGPVAVAFEAFRSFYVDLYVHADVRTQ